MDVADCDSVPGQRTRTRFTCVMHSESNIALKGFAATLVGIQDEAFMLSVNCLEILKLQVKGGIHAFSNLS